MAMKTVFSKAVLVIPVFMAAQALSAGSLQKLDQDHVAVRASAVPLGQLLRELDGMMRLDNLFIEPAIESRVVNVNIDRVKLTDAANQILKESRLDFIVWGRRIFVGDPTAAVQLARGGARPGTEAAAQVETAEAVAPAETPSAGTETLTTEEYSMVGENVTYHDPNFVTYKMRPEVVRRRTNINVATIP
jgi:hypothetical protein